MNINDLVQNENLNYIIAAKYLSDLLAKGVFAGIGKDIWEKMKNKATGETASKAVEDFTKNPDNEKNRVRIELMMQLWFEQDEQFKLEMIDMFKKAITEFNQEKTSFDKVKNVINNSTINVKQGNIHVGDKIVK